MPKLLRHVSGRKQRRLRPRRKINVYFPVACRLQISFRLTTKGRNKKSAHGSIVTDFPRKIYPFDLKKEVQNGLIASRAMIETVTKVERELEKEREKLRRTSKRWQQARRRSLRMRKQR